jgi:2-keto-4-pentenoate hydratase/2-oxohepta-3-ene-1,7-dioic acid hydratase in catechol pathway
MQLLRFGPSGEEKPGFVDPEGQIRDASTIISDWSPQTITHNVHETLAQTDYRHLPVVPPDTRIGPCVKNPSKYICVGLNYSDHAEESGMEPPAEPILFMKATSAIVGPNDAIRLPRNAQKVDWEVELGVVIGKEAKYVSEAQATDYIAGYCVLNDVSERAFQMDRSGQWVKGKSADTFGPLGPYLVTQDDIPDPNNLHLWLEVNGERFQDGTTANMIFDVPYLVSYISQFMTLLPGDIIATGTPAGVGMGQSEPVYLKAGDLVQLGISRLGEQAQRVEAAR